MANDGRPTKHKISHHSPVACRKICNCSTCGGKRLQTLRTINDHAAKDRRRLAANGVDESVPQAGPSNVRLPPIREPMEYTNESFGIASSSRSQTSSPPSLSHATFNRSLSSSPTQSVRRESSYSPRLDAAALLRPVSPADSIPELLAGHDPPRQQDDLTNHYFRNLLNDRLGGAPLGEYREENLDGFREEELQPGELDDENFGLPSEDEEDDEGQLVDDNLALRGGLDLADDPDDEQDNNADDEPVDFPALDEPAVIRNLYVNTIVQKYSHRNHTSGLAHFISSFEEALESNPTVGPLDLARMAKTIGTIERRLGLSTTDLITTYTVCPKCSKRYSPIYVADSRDAACAIETCDGVLYVEKTLATGRKRCSPRTFPCASLIAWIRRMLARDGIASLLQSWRKQDDHELSAPITAQDWSAEIDLDSPLGDIKDGWGWRARVAGLQRIINPMTGTLTEELPLGQPIRFVSLPMGLSLSMNVDWFQTNKEGCYSVGACYFIINNLPRHLRFLRENMCLALVMPGPKEPGDYALDQMMEPLVDELLRLQQGVMMPVWSSEAQEFEEQRVYADLHNQIADLIARIKMIGGAGVASEHNFCLYCRMRLSALSVPAGFIRQNFLYRVPEEELENRAFYKSLQTVEERRAFFEFTGTRYTELDRLGGWDAARRSPPDAMHLIHLGCVNWIAKQILFAPGMFNKRQGKVEEPLDRLNAWLDRLILPYNHTRLPPKLGKTTKRIKAEQWKLFARFMPMMVFEAWRDGDTISNNPVPRGRSDSSAARFQVRRAKLLQARRAKYFTSIGRPDLIPPVEDCFSSRDPRLHYLQIMRASVLFIGLFVHQLSPNQAQFLHELAETLCTRYIGMNCHLPPNFHQLIHLEEFILENGSLYNTHAWAFERANNDVTRINTNGHGNGVLEGTLMKGWWGSSQIQGLVRRLQAIPDRTRADNKAISNLIQVLQGGVESERHRGDVMVFLARADAAYGRIHGMRDSTKLSPQSKAADLHALGIYEPVLGFCQRMWPMNRIYGFGLAIPGGIYLPSTGSTRLQAYVEYDGIRYGSHFHSSGKRACYGYINHRQPVRVERILLIEVPNWPQMRTICVLVRPFKVPAIEADFPWSAWQGHLGAACWSYNDLGDLLAVPPAELSGVFALGDSRLSYGHYWITLSLDNIEPEHEDDHEQDHGNGQFE